MPSKVSSVEINILFASSVVRFGDAVNVSPKQASKSFGGAGGFNTGDGLNVNNIASGTNSVDPDAGDQNISINN
ncbi:spore germination protein [Pseudalkalibacillus caeni]|uniref:Spore germination protein n=1 Tax=Exobacillus caeni TaxID=2574798 RepID=A0A5R9F0W5_9BACL|nr:spore germination protein [Pseudalkalibacillus caeni]TLS37197.1 spore germination protein [Pseudalkalibacillus caeni]